MAPGEIGYSPFPKYDISNYGGEFFTSGSSNLDAEKLLLSAAKKAGTDDELWNKLRIKVEVSRNVGGDEWYVAYEDKLRDLVNVDLFSTNTGVTLWSVLPVGWSESLRYEIWLPDTGGDQSALMGKTAIWDFLIEGRTN